MKAAGTKEIGLLDIRIDEDAIYGLSLGRITGHGIATINMAKLLTLKTNLSPAVERDHRLFILDIPSVPQSWPTIGTLDKKTGS